MVEKIVHLTSQVGIPNFQLLFLEQIKLLLHDTRNGSFLLRGEGGPR